MERELMLVTQTRLTRFLKADLYKKSVSFGSGSRKEQKISIDEKQNNAGITRRQFIKDAAWGTAILGLGGTILYQGSEIKELKKGQEVLMSEIDLQGRRIKATQRALKRAKAGTLHRIPKLVKEVGPSTVSVLKQEINPDDVNTRLSSAGSGFILSGKESPIIITNDHVVDKNVAEDEKTGKKYLRILFYGQDENIIYAKAEVVARDASLDLAALKFLPDQNIPDFVKPIKKFRNIEKDPYERGEPVITIGTPLNPKHKDSVTLGIISNDNIKDYKNASSAVYIQTDAAMNDGNSGGALFDLKGNLAGINTWKISRLDVEGMGYSARIDVLKYFLSGNNIEVPGFTDQ